jgi:hypothetical protein
MQAEVERRTMANAARLAKTWGRQICAAEMGMTMEQFVVVIDALIAGLIGQRLLTPSVVTDETIVAAFVALA